MSTKSHSSKSSTGTGDHLDGGTGKGKEPSVSVSARKMKNNSDVVEDKKELIKTGELSSKISPSCLSDPDPAFKNTNSEKVAGGRVHRRRRSASALRIGIGEVGGSNFHVNHSLMEFKDYTRGTQVIGSDQAVEMQIENPGEGKTTRRKAKLIVKTRLKEVSNCLTTSKELVRVLNHVWGHEDQDPERPSSTLSLITALKGELDRAKARVDHLIKDQSLEGGEIELLMKRFTEEKAAWKYKERARIRSAISSMADEVEVEKKLRRQAERLNKTIGRELADAKVSLSKAIKDLQREKRAKEIFEQICDELAKGIGEDRAQFEELKKESAKVREEVEKEREMLQLADVLREERVQMKLSEAKYHFEEKNAAVERLKDELEAYLITQLGNENGEEDYCCNKFDKIKELEAYLKKINFGSCQDHQILERKLEQEEGDDNQNEEDDSSDGDEESDLHSIELNMDNNNKSYRWSFVHASQNGSKRNSFEKETNGRKSLSDKIQWGSICLNRKSSNTTKIGEFVARKSLEHSERFDWDRFSELFAHTQTQKLQDQHHNEGDEITHTHNNNNNNKSVKCLRDILFSEAAESTAEDQRNEIGKRDGVQSDEVCAVARKE